MQPLFARIATARSFVWVFVVRLSLFVADSLFVYIPQCSTEKGKGVRRGSGFITEVEIKGQRKCLLITCNHVLQSQSDALNADISFGRVGDSKEETIIKGKNLFHDFFKTDDNDVSLCWGVHQVSCL